MTMTPSVPPHLERLRFHAGLLGITPTRMWRVRENRNRRHHNLICSQPLNFVHPSTMNCSLPVGHDGPHLSWAALNEPPPYLEGACLLADIRHGAHQEIRVHYEETT